MKRIEHISLTLFILALSFVPFLWLHGNQLLLGYDNVYPLNPLSFLNDRIFSWTSVPGFGIDQSGIQGSIIIHFIDSLPQLIGFSHQMSQKIVFSFWFFLILISAYVLIRRLEKIGLVKSEYLRYIFPVLYAFNFYILQAWWVAERTKFSLVVAAPLILSIILPMVFSTLSLIKVTRGALVCSLILTVFNGGGWVGLPLYGGLLVLLGSIYLFFSIAFLIRKRRKDFLFLALFFVLFGLSFIALNAYTLLPFFLTTFKDYGSQVAVAGGIPSLVEWTRYLSANTSILNLLRLQGIPDLYNSLQTHPYAAFYLNNPLMVFSSFIFPLLLFLSLINREEGNKKIISLFLFLVIISLFYTAGIHKPTGYFFELLMKKIPGFVIFRSPIFKFGYAYWLSVSFLIGLSISNFLEFILKKTKRGSYILKLSVVLPILVISLIVAYYFPYIKGDIFRISSAKVYSRVEIPSYVNDFSSWWRKNQNNNKILLLPKLNDNWLFEQYRWGYLSLFPVLGNFANTGIIENTDILTGSESDLLNKLYAAINKKDYLTMDKLSSVLGISYFLVRNDFDYDIPDQETDNPLVIEKNISGNANIKFVKSFGEWNVYGYMIPNLLISARSSVIASNTFVDYSFLLPPDPLVISDSDASNYLTSISKNIVIPECISCRAEKEDPQIVISKPKILIDSSLYELVQLKSRLTMPKIESYNQKLFRFVGDSAKSAGQINELITQDKGDMFVNMGRTTYIDLISQMGDLLKDVMGKSPNPYSTLVIVENYLDAQYSYLNDLLLRATKKNDQVNIEKILYELSGLNDRLKKIYGEKDFNLRKEYKYRISKSGIYNLKIETKSLGSIGDFSKVYIQIDNQDSSMSGHLNGEFIDFGSIEFSAGEHFLRLNLPPQKNILSDHVSQRISGSNCFASFVEGFSPDNFYELKFMSKNNFDPIFFYFVDLNRDDGFSPSHIGYFSLSGEQVRKNRVVTSPFGNVQSNKNTGILRVGFCAPSLSESSYRENIFGLQLVQLLEPKIVLYSNSSSVLATTPKINFRKINQTYYKVDVRSSVNPFYLVFGQRYSLGWKSTEGVHLLGNGFENVWLIDRKGDFSLDINYQPQKHSYYGEIISVIFLIASFALLYLLKKYEGKQK